MVYDWRFSAGAGLIRFGLKYGIVGLNSRTSSLSYLLGSNLHLVTVPVKDRKLDCFGRDKFFICFKTLSFSPGTSIATWR